ncbi:Uncharacterized protein APZ42_003606 [Daphnia magna]|uniref:Uncharacterized protein n=1 Tax=Daphnia magna TaxID=35525 RepID=A0A168EMD2_9CRUS|nr:Uncharacterized protein APZ42_003606 [Daphnia magna]
MHQLTLSWKNILPLIPGNKSFSFPSFHYAHLALVIALTLFVV